MLDQQVVNDIVQRALAEDAPQGDITTLLTIDSDAQAQAVLATRQQGVFCGEQLFTAACKLTDSEISVTFEKHDGDHCLAGDVIAIVDGPARGILTAERIGLNFAQRLSGIATLTAEYVDAIAGTNATILDTRKTTPTLRVLERYAVVCGGGSNHRVNLSAAFMAKDNHLAVLQAGDKDLTTELRRIKTQLPEDMVFEVEVDRIDQIEPVLSGGVDVIMLDNFSLEDLAYGVKLVAGRAKVEASGGVNLNTVRDIALTGVDYISVGALTHSAQALDLGLDVSVELS